jgi:hypothetical protein
MSQIGFAPVHMDQSGNMFVDTDNVQGYDESDGVGGPGRISRLARRQNRLARKYAAASADYVDEMPTADLYQLAAAKGLLQENQFDGLGSVAVAASGTGSLTDTLNRDVWAKSLVLDSDDPTSILVTSVTVAGLPYNVGSKGAPLSSWGSTSTRFGISFGRRPIGVGQAVVVNVSNLDAGAAHTVTGNLIVDELAPYMVQRLRERTLLEMIAATEAG